MDENEIRLPHNFWEIASIVLKNIPSRTLDTYADCEIGIVVECAVVFGNPDVVETKVVSLSDSETSDYSKSRLIVCGFGDYTIMGFVNEIKSFYRRDDSLRIVAFTRRKDKDQATEFVDFDLGNFLILGKVHFCGGKGPEFEWFR